MDNRDEIIWMAGQISIVVLAVLLLVRILFRRPTQKPPTRSSHLVTGIICILVALVWSGLCLLICFNLSFAGGKDKGIVVVLGVGGAVFLGLVWRGVRSFWRTFHNTPPSGEGTQAKSNEPQEKEV